MEDCFWRLRSIRVVQLHCIALPDGAEEVVWVTMSSTSFQIGALIIIVPLAAAFLCGCLCICKHRFYLWTLRRDDSESDAGPKILAQVKNPKKVDNAEKYVAPADQETGIMKGAESESELAMIRESGKNATRKSFCA